MWKSNKRKKCAWISDPITVKLELRLNFILIPCKFFFFFFFMVELNSQEWEKEKHLLYNLSEVVV